MLYVGIHEKMVKNSLYDKRNHTEYHDKKIYKAVLKLTSILCRRLKVVSFETIEKLAAVKKHHGRVGLGRFTTDISSTYENNIFLCIMYQNRYQARYALL